MKEECSKNSLMKYEVFTPENYSKGKEYPLLFILHGNGENLEIAKEHWSYKTAVEKNSVVVYVQSSQVQTSSGFCWTDSFSTTREELAFCFNEVKGKYSIDENKVIIAGFSAGAKAAMSIAMNNTFPIKGFISLCGLVIDDLTDENIQTAKSRGLKAVFADGEKSTYNDFPKLKDIFEKNNFPFQAVIYKDMGHQCPEGKEMEKINKDSIDFILG